MCGIFGIIGAEFSNEDINAMSESIEHRGKDFFGIEKFGDKFLAHRRLGIVDISDNANQPMFSHNGRYCVVYNGEIYNYLELKKEVESHSNFVPYGENKWKTTSDTEILLEAFSLWGVNFVHKLNGMFAVAIYDKESQTTYLFRDRLGEKPLFYYHKNDVFAFASEIKALKANKTISKDWNFDNQAFSEFLYLGYIPAPRTVYEDVKKFPAASYGILKNGKLKIEKYWSALDSLKAETFSDEKNVVEKLEDILLKSVELRLPKEVSFGTFLSGGIDSSLITAMVQKLSATTIDTYTLGFAEKSFVNEMPWAKKISQHLGTNHHEVIVSETDILDLIPKLTSIYDEPFGDSSALPTIIVSELVSKNHKVALAGDGGDELFFGYGSYIWAQRLSNPLLRTFSNPISTLLSFGGNRYKRVSKLLKYDDINRIKSHIFSQEQYCFAIKDLEKIINSNVYKPIGFDEDISTAIRKLSVVEKQAHFDLQYYLTDDLLVKVDRASMYNTLEVRTPMLDHNLVEYALNIDQSLKLKNGEAKYVLKQVLYKYVPAELYDRPKWGFGAPLSKWMKTILKDYFEDLLFTENSIINKTEVEKLYKKYLSDYDYLYNRLWLISRINEFLELNK